MKTKRLKTDTHRTVSAELRDAAIDLWVAGNDAGGAVGFVPGASREAVAATFDSCLPQIEAGTSTLVTARLLDSPDGATNQTSPATSSTADNDQSAGDSTPAPIDAMAFLTQPPRGEGRPNFSVVVTIERLVLAPRLWGGGLGAEFMHDLHTLSAELPDAVHTEVMYRSGHGLERFYSRLGYTQVGWLPDCMTIPTADGGVEWRSAGVAMRRLDGKPYTDLP